MCIHTTPTTMHSDAETMSWNRIRYSYIERPYLHCMGYSLTHEFVLIYSYGCAIKIATLAALSYLFLMGKNPTLE